MNFKKALKEGCCTAHLKGETKEAIIEEMIGMLESAGLIRDRVEALESVMSRERKMSTGMQCGVAIPHGKTSAVKKLATAIGLKKEGVDFEAMDGKPSRIFVMTLSPVDHSGPHIQYLSEISKLLSNPKIRERILQAESAAEIIRILAG
ncbi:MAG: PTS sugar transporter subunit IIA [Kiritimatiellia bacterium]